MDIGVLRKSFIFYRKFMRVNTRQNEQKREH